MRISKNHMSGLRDAAVRDFENRMVPFLYEHFPEESEVLGEDGTRVRIRKGIHRAAQYEIVEEHDVCLYIELMYVLSEEFNSDPNYPWAREILVNQQQDPSDRIESVYDMCEQLQNAAGGREAVM